LPDNGPRRISQASYNCSRTFLSCSSPIRFALLTLVSTSLCFGLIVCDERPRPFSSAWYTNACCTIHAKVDTSRAASSKPYIPRRRVNRTLLQRSAYVRLMMQTTQTTPAWSVAVSWAKKWTSGGRLSVESAVRLPIPTMEASQIMSQCVSKGRIDGDDEVACQYETSRARVVFLECSRKTVTRGFHKSHCCLLPIRGL
jgi:hypothetical protein